MPVPGAAARRRVDLTFAAAVLITLIAGLAAVWWLLEQAAQVPAAKDRATLRADAVKTGATIALGTGGAAFLLLAYRRQRMEEVDTRERRITELYTAAVEQLGHEKAPVRLGALYSLERLAQDNPVHHQTVVDMICAYLRMPFTLPAQNKPGVEKVEQTMRPAEDGIPAAHPLTGQDPAHEELQVRQTAQRILAAHLQRPPKTSGKAAQRRRASTQWAFWPNISLDLTAATLVDLNLPEVSVAQARFDRASFHGDAGFDRASFQGAAGFDRASFHGDAGFDSASFQGAAGFDSASFQGAAGFDGASFEGIARFKGASFQGIADFNGTRFQGAPRFSEASFQGAAWFDGASFQLDAWFLAARFQGDADFNRATFRASIHFNKASFHGPARFGKVRFQDFASFEGAQVLHLDDRQLEKLRVWPDRHTIRPDPAHSTCGTLVRAKKPEEVEPAVPPPSTSSHHTQKHDTDQMQ
jgi:hypothetical protein